MSTKFSEESPLQDEEPRISPFCELGRELIEASRSRRPRQGRPARSNRRGGR